MARSCALSHGHYGQGTPAGYMVKQIEAYIKEERINPRMVITSSLHSISEEEIDDIAAYYESVNLEKINPVLNRIPAWPGNIELGSELYKRRLQELPS
ncbi:MAG: hypothetical protein KZQ81_07345 [Candidatus Thiodiazotropha sp. (ex Rostrolucina anterorostrata)]|nr:hypothetical protein [Candidatus Thiodiazotropha sp. (ex Rostrolucina anterorostrata)]